MCDLQSSVPEWLIEHPETASVFEKLGIDTACSGRSLLYLCEQNGLDSVEVLRRLNEVAS